MIYNQWAAADEYGTRMSIGVTHTHTHSECKFFRDIVRPKGITMNYDSMISVIQSTSHTFHLTYNRLNDIVSTWEILSQTKKNLSCIFFLSDRWIHITHRGQNMQRDRIFHVNGAVWFILSNREVIIFSINPCFTFTGLCSFSRQSMHINILKINT